MVAPHIKRYLGDTIRYTSCGYHCWRQCILKVRIRDGVIQACEPDDTINAGIAREDGRLPDEILDKGLIQTRPCAKGYVQADRFPPDPKKAGKDRRRDSIAATNLAKCS